MMSCQVTDIPLETHTEHEFTKQEDALLLMKWKPLQANKRLLNKYFPTRSREECQSRFMLLQPPKSKKKQLDDQLLMMVSQHGCNWDKIADIMQLPAKKLETRYTNYLDPKLNRSPWRQKDDQQLKEFYKQNGSQWKLFSQITNRSEIDIRTRFYKLRLIKKFRRGIRKTMLKARAPSLGKEIDREVASQIQKKTKCEEEYPPTQREDFIILQSSTIQDVEAISLLKQIGQRIQNMEAKMPILTKVQEPDMVINMKMEKVRDGLKSLEYVCKKLRLKWKSVSLMVLEQCLRNYNKQFQKKYFMMQEQFRLVFTDLFENGNSLDGIK